MANGSHSLTNGRRIYPQDTGWIGGVQDIIVGDHVFELCPSEITSGDMKSELHEGFVKWLGSFTTKPEKKCGEQNVEEFKALGTDSKKKCEEGG